MARTVEVVNGKVRYEGRTLAEWVPQIVTDLVAAADPLEIVLFGSVARGDDDPDSDVDVLVVLVSVARNEKHERMGELRNAITAPVPVDVLITDPAELAVRGDLPGILRIARREGKVCYARPA